MGVFQNMVEELITDLSSQEKDTKSIASKSSQSSQRSLLSSPDFLPVASQRVLSACEAGKASRLFVASLPAAEEQEEHGTPVTGCDVLIDEPDGPIDQLYLDQCCEWFKRETRASSRPDRSLYPGIESEVRHKKRKLTDEQADTLV